MMAVNNENTEINEFLKLAKRVRVKVDEWPEWKRSLRLTKHASSIVSESKSVKSIKTRKSE